MVGIFWSYMRYKFNSIYISLISHLLADLSIMVVYLKWIYWPAHAVDLFYPDDFFWAGWERFEINKKAEKYADSPDFSVKIRQWDDPS